MAKNKEKRRDDQNSCLTDGCFYFDFDIFNWGDGCANDDGGCLNFDGGCMDIDGGCLEFDTGCFNIFDGCSFSFGGAFRLVVIIGLMLYGDWDYQKRTAKSSTIEHHRQ